MEDKKPHENCPRCAVPLNVRACFHNLPANCEDHVTFPYMQIGQSMHMECYIEHVIDSHLRKLIKEDEK